MPRFTAQEAEGQESVGGRPGGEQKFARQRGRAVPAGGRCQRAAGASGWAEPAGNPAGHAGQAGATAAAAAFAAAGSASRMRPMGSSSRAAETNQASNTLGGRETPESSIEWNKAG